MHSEESWRIHLKFQNKFSKLLQKVDLSIEETNDSLTNIVIKAAQQAGREAPVSKELITTKETKKITTCKYRKKIKQKKDETVARTAKTCQQQKSGTSGNLTGQDRRNLESREARKLKEA